MWGCHGKTVGRSSPQEALDLYVLHDFESQDNARGCVLSLARALGLCYHCSLREGSP